jgi:hypothetical protein
MWIRISGGQDNCMCMRVYGDMVTYVGNECASARMRVHVRVRVRVPLSVCMIHTFTFQL